MRKLNLLLFALLISGFQSFAQNTATLPYSTNFDTEAEFGTWTTLNSDDDSGEWVYSPDYFGLGNSGSPVYVYSSANPGNDWLFSPSFSLEVGESYLLEFKYAALSPSYYEKLSLHLSTDTTAETVITELHDFGTFNGTGYQAHQQEITVTETGNYNLCFYSYSDATMLGIGIEDFSIDIVTKVKLIESQTVTVYPNPSKNGKFSIRTGELHNISNISIHNITGKKISLLPKKSSQNNTYTLDLTNFAKGIYFIKVESDSASVTSKIIFN